VIKDQGKLAGMDREVVQALLDSGAVNFKAIGEAVGKFGPSIVLNGDGEDNFCWTMRLFIRIFKRPTPWGELDELGELRKHAAPEIRGG